MPVTPIAVKALLLMLALAAGCFEDPPATNPDSSEGGATTNTSSGESDDGTDWCGCQEIGIEACDFYITQYCACIEDHAPESTKQSMLDAFERTCESWADAAQDSGADALEEGCEAALAAVAMTAAGWGCGFESVNGSCLGYCGTDMKIPDGDTTCYCDAECESRKDCCGDFVDRCGEKVIEPEGTPVIELAAPTAEGTLDAAEATQVWPSLAAYPQLAPTLLAALAAGDDPLAIVGGLRDSFAGTRWASLDEWDRFGAIDLAAGFVTVRDGVLPQQGSSLGCLGGFIEAVRLLLEPRVEIAALLQPAAECRAQDDRACDADVDTGLLVLANLQRWYLPDWRVDNASPQDVDDLRSLFDRSPMPYFVAASHRSRRDGVRRYHHMLVVLVDDHALGEGPIVFDVTGLRGVSLRRVPWLRLHAYLGGSLAASKQFRYAPGSMEVAVLTGPHEQWQVGSAL